MRLRKTWASVLWLGGVALVACAASGPEEGGAGGAAQSAEAKDDGGGAKNAKPGPVVSKAPSTATCVATPDHSSCMACCLGKDEGRINAELDAWDRCACAAAHRCGTACEAALCNPGPSEGSTSSGGTSSSSGGASSSSGGASSSSGGASSSSGGDSSGGPCGACLAAIDQCDAVGDKACAADPTCAAARKCETDANCDHKPPGPDESYDFPGETGR